jgi:hypothetical protein
MSRGCRSMKTIDDMCGGNHIAPTTAVVSAECIQNLCNHVTGIIVHSATALRLLVSFHRNRLDAHFAAAQNRIVQVDHRCLD